VRASTARRRAPERLPLPHQLCKRRKCLYDAFHVEAQLQFVPMPLHVPQAAGRAAEHAPVKASRGRRACSRAGAAAGQTCRGQPGLPSLCCAAPGQRGGGGAARCYPHECPSSGNMSVSTAPHRSLRGRILADFHPVREGDYVPLREGHLSQNNQNGECLRQRTASLDF